MLKIFNNYYKPLIPFILALIMGILFLVFKTPPIKRDSVSYHRAGIEFSKQNYEVIKESEPGHTIFIGICFKIFRGSDNAVRIVQIFLSAFVSLMVYSITSHYYGKNIGLIAGLIYSLCPTFAHYPGFFLKETLLVFLFFLSYWLVLKTIHTNNIMLAILSAFILIFLLLSKTIYLFFGIFIVMMILVFNKNQIARNRKSIINMSIIAMLPLICFYGWLQYLYNQNIKGRHIGINLLYNGAELALSDREKTARLIALVSRNLSEKIFPDIDFRTLWPYPRIAGKLKEEADRKYSDLSNRNDRYLHMALDLYLEHPFGFIINRITTLLRLNAFQYPSRLNETDRWKDFYNRGNNKSLVIIILDLLLKLVSNPIFWALGGFIVIKKKDMPIYPLLLPILYVNLVYCFLDGIPRYGLPALPFYLMSGSVFFYYSYKRVKDRVKELN